MDHANDRIRYGVDRPAEIDESAPIETRSTACVIGEPAAAEPNDSRFDATTGAGRFLRGLIVDAILNDDRTIREFRIRRPE